MSPLSRGYCYCNVFRLLLQAPRFVTYYYYYSVVFRPTSHYLSLVHPSLHCGFRPIVPTVRRIQSGYRSGERQSGIKKSNVLRQCRLVRVISCAAGIGVPEHYRCCRCRRVVERVGVGAIVIIIRGCHHSGRKLTSGVVSLGVLKRYRMRPIRGTPANPEESAGRGCGTQRMLNLLWSSTNPQRTARRGCGTRGMHPLRWSSTNPGGPASRGWCSTRMHSLRWSSTIPETSARRGCGTRGVHSLRWSPTSPEGPASQGWCTRGTRTLRWSPVLQEGLLRPGWCTGRMNVLQWSSPPPKRPPRRGPPDRTPRTPRAP